MSLLQRNKEIISWSASAGWRAVKWLGWVAERQLAAAEAGWKKRGAKQGTQYFIHY